MTSLRGFDEFEQFWERRTSNRPPVTAAMYGVLEQLRHAREHWNLSASSPP
jgi:hypothetical protein